MSKKEDQTENLDSQENDNKEGNQDTAELDTDSTVAELEQKLAEAEARAQENWDKAVRAQAELENVRRRSQRDLENAHKYALEKFLHDLLPIHDSLEMGLVAASNEDADIAKLREGSELILKMFIDLMNKYNIEMIDPEGHLFDPEQHQAMTMLESPDHEPNTVVSVMQKGYKLNDRLVRPAMVAVSKVPESTQENSEKNIDEKV
ncbi:MAG: nucleotide exchange factor GrpE [Thioalkalispiraceae bacterium]|jgi:molecular chaperone GrpE